MDLVTGEDDDRGVGAGSNRQELEVGAGMDSMHRGTMR